MAESTYADLKKLYGQASGAQSEPKMIYKRGAEKKMKRNTKRGRVGRYIFFPQRMPGYSRPTSIKDFGSQEQLNKIP